MLLSALTLMLQILYFICVAGLSIYGCNALWLTFQMLRAHSPAPAPTSSSLFAAASATSLPTVTIQLPIYNEQYVVQRLLQACARLNYPREKLQIQILDDSDDYTTQLIQYQANELRKNGLQVDVVTRENRAGYKAGALQYGLESASGEFIAIFDADFEPTEDFLYHTLPHFFESDNWQIGFIQTRWTHLNLNYSPLTHSQALALDGHFVIEQAARQSAGYFFGFNGSGGVWRRTCIEDIAVGAWQTDTLCEDLDLSYRAQLAGWRGLFLPDVESPAEIPPQLLAFKRQQFRWAKGSIQTLRKLARRIVRADIAGPVKYQALFHLGSYLVHPLVLLLLLISLPLALLPVEPILPLPLLSLTSLGPPLLYAVAQHKLHGSAWFRRWRYLPILMLLGTGLSLNNSIAVSQGLFRRGGEFLRTPKFNVAHRSDRWSHSAYRLPIPPVLVAEFLLMCYALATAAILIMQRNWWSLPFLLIYAGGFGLMFTMGLWQSRTLRSWRAAQITRRALHYYNHRARI